MAVHSPEAPIRDAHARKSVSQMRTHTHAELEEAGCARWECHVGGAVRVMHQQGMRPSANPSCSAGCIKPMCAVAPSRKSGGDGHLCVAPGDLLEGARV